MFGKKRPFGAESDWIPFYMFKLAGTRIWVGDAHFAASADDGEIVELRPGMYQAWIKQKTFGTDVRNSRLRFCLQGVQPEALNKIGETWADVATQGICDFDLYSKVESEHPDLADNPDELFDVEDPGVFTLAGKAELIRVSSGFGDGTFNLYELLAGGERVGVEVEMIRPDEEYPFKRTFPDGGGCIGGWLVRSRGWGR